MPRLGKTQKSILEVLASRKREIRVKQIWREIGDGISYRAVLEAIWRLERAGLVSRTERGYLLTEKGWAFVERARARAKENGRECSLEIHFKVMLLPAHIRVLSILASVNGWLPSHRLKIRHENRLSVLQHLAQLGFIELEKAGRGYRARITSVGMEVLRGALCVSRGA